MKLIQITKEEYASIESLSENTTFLQLSTWGKFKSESADYNVEYYKDESSDMGIMVLVRKIGFFKAAYIPRVNIKTSEGTLLETFKDKFDIVFLESDEYTNINTSGFTQVSEYIQPKTTFLTDLTKIDENLSNIPSSSHRRNIRKGESFIKEDLSIQFSKVNELSEDELDQIVEILSIHSSSKGYSIRKKEYFKKLSLVSGSRWYILKKNEKILCAAFVITYKEKAFELYLPTTKEASENYLNYYLKYKIFMELKLEGVTKYDHWGIFLNDPKRKGFSEFKMKFGGKELTYPNNYLYTSLLLRPFKNLILKRF